MNTYPAAFKIHAEDGLWVVRDIEENRVRAFHNAEDCWTWVGIILDHVKELVHGV